MDRRYPTINPLHPIPLVRKLLNMLLVHRFGIDPTRSTCAISDNLAALHGGKPSKYIWVDSYCMPYAQLHVQI